MADTIRVPSKYFGSEKRAALCKLIDDKYSNRVVRHVGLCVCLYDFEEVGDSYIYPTDGAAHVNVKFLMVVFKPFPGEVLTGRVCEITKDLVRVSLGFFDDLYVAASSLPQPSEFMPAKDGMEDYWCWNYFESERKAGATLGGGEGGSLEHGAGTGEEAQGEEAAQAEEDQGFFVVKNMGIRVVVKSVEFGAYREDGPDAHGNAPSTAASAQQQQALGLAPPMQARDRSNSEVLRNLQSTAPMVVMAHCNTPFTGMMAWWDNTEGDQTMQAEQPEA